MCLLVLTNPVFEKIGEVQTDEIAWRDGTSYILKKTVFSRIIDGRCRLSYTRMLAEFGETVFESDLQPFQTLLTTVSGS